MAGRRKSTPPRQLQHHWYLREWAEGQPTPKTQADAQRELGWSKASASTLWRGEQRYTQDLIDEVAVWLHIRPFELLMLPSEAMALRQLRQAGLTIAASASEQDASTPDAAEAGPSRRHAG